MHTDICTYAYFYITCKSLKFVHNAWLSMYMCIKTYFLDDLALGEEKGTELAK